MLEVRPPPAPDLPQLPRSPFLHAVLTTPVDRTGACRFLPCPRGLPRLTGGSASTTSLLRNRGVSGFVFSAEFLAVLGCFSRRRLSRPAQASLALRPARSLARLKADFCPRLRSGQLPDRPARWLPCLTDIYMGGSSLHW